MKKIISLMYLSFISVLLTGAFNVLGYSSYSSSYYDPFPILIIIMLIYVAVFIVWIAAALWAYKDAKKRGLNNPALWGLVVFLCGLIGLIIYLVLRNNLQKDNKTSRFCTSCGRNIPFDANICPYCKKRFETYL